MGLILNWISHAAEFQILYPQLTPKDFETLLRDHINRKHSGDLEEVKYRIVAKTHSLLFGLLDIATTFRNLDISLMTIDTFKSIVQATPLSPYSQILQLPNVDSERFTSGSVDDIRTLGKLFTYDDQKIGKILGIDDEVKLQETLSVAVNIPHLKLLRAEFVAVSYTHLDVYKRQYLDRAVIVARILSEREHYVERNRKKGVVVE